MKRRVLLLAGLPGLLLLIRCGTGGLAGRTSLPKAKDWLVSIPAPPPLTVRPH
jgi:hypothetical protein